MANQNYDAALRRLLAHEGGYTNHPSDPGGPTNFGITIHDYRNYVKPDATAADVRAMQRRRGEGDLSRALLERAALRRAAGRARLRGVRLRRELRRSAARRRCCSGSSAFPRDGRMTDALLAAVRKRDAAS